MVRKAVILFIAFTVGITVLALGYSLLAGDEEPVKRQKQAQRGGPKLKPWDGKVTRVYNTIFVRRNTQVGLVDVTYSHANTAATDVDVRLNVTSPGGARPSWLKPSAFQVRSENQRVYTPKVSFTRDGVVQEVSVRFTNLPTTGLGATCEDRAGRKADPLGLFVFGPNGLFIVQLIPPPAPAGHCFDRPVKTPPECLRAADQEQLAKERSTQRKRNLRRAKTRAGRKRLARRYRREAPARARQTTQRRAILKSERCAVRKPSAGRGINSADRRVEAATRRRASRQALTIPPAQP